MSRTPISRDTMLSLKAQKDEEIRQKAEADRQHRISDIVTNIYDSAKTAAETSDQKSYAWVIPHNFPNGDLVTLIESLRDLFPGCTVEHRIRSVVLDMDGKVHDNTMTGIPHNIPILKERPVDVIVVDWS